MEVKAKLRHLRVSPKKIRLLANLAKNKDLNTALAQLEFSNKQTARPLIKLLKSAQANAENNFELDPESLIVKEILVDQGPTLKRWRARAFGRAAQIRKKTCHITVILQGEKLEKAKKRVSKESVPAKKKKELKLVKSLEEVKQESKKDDKNIQEKSYKQEESSKGPKPEQGKFKGFAKRVFARKSG